MSEIDSLNGAEWIVRIDYSYPVARSFDMTQAARALKYGDPVEWTPWKPMRENPFARVQINSGQISIRKAHGRFEIQINRWPWTPLSEFHTDQERWFTCEKLGQTG